MSLIGIAIVAVIFIAVVACIFADKNTNKKFLAQFYAKHQTKDKYADFTITKNRELIYNLSSGSVAGFKVWKLDDIGRISFSDLKIVTRQFSIQDRNGKTMKGQYLTPSKKQLKEYKFSSFDVRGGQNSDDIIKLIRRNAPHITFTVNGNAV